MYSSAKRDISASLIASACALVLLVSCRAQQQAPVEDEDPALNGGSSSKLEQSVGEQDVEGKQSASTESKESAMVEEVNASLDGAGMLKVGTGSLLFTLKAGSCRKETATVTTCNDVELTVERSGSPTQTLLVDQVHVDSAATLYRGALDDNYRKNGHSFVISDVNGDGHEDLLIWTGKEGNYGGPSYAVYLSEQAGRFVLNQAFTDLFPGTNGLFRIEGKRIKTASSDGCCFHVFDTYEVEDGKPVLVERVTEDTNDPGKPVVKTERLIDGELKEVPSP